MADVVLREAPTHRVEELSEKVRRIAYAMVRRLPSHISVDDLISAGYVGLACALQRYGATDESCFEAYASRRIRGAIQDALRGYDPLTRTQRRKLKRIRAAEHRLAEKLGRRPDATEVAEAAELTEARYWYTLAQCTHAAAVDITPYDLEENNLGAEPWSAEEDMVNRHDSRSVHRALERLPERLCTVMKLYYFEDLSLREIGETLGVTEARVHQLRAEALTLLRTFYQGSPEIRFAA